MCKRKLRSSFSEYSHKAGSYRGELLELLAIHILLAALEEYYKIPPPAGKICCDNEGALYKSKEFRRRIPVRSSQADIKRALCNVKCGLKVKLSYEWVQSHQDRYKLWHQLTIEQQLNCYCDTLAKDSVARNLLITTAPLQQRLPRESVAVFVGGLKQTTDVAKDVRFALAWIEAERFYTSPSNPKDAFGKRKSGGGLD